MFSIWECDLLMQSSCDEVMLDWDKPNSMTRRLKLGFQGPHKENVMR